MAEPIDRDLLDATRRVLRDEGWSRTTAERIAREAGISRVTLHRRGIGRDDLLAALADAAAAAYREALWPALVAAGSGRQRLERALEALCRVADEHLEVLVALQAVAGAVFHEDADGPVGTLAAFVEPLERLLRDGAGDGSLRATPDPHATATVLFNAVGGTYVHLRADHRWPADRARDGLLDLLVIGLAGTG